jgi:hypothetical protein
VFCGEPLDRAAFATGIGTSSPASLTGLHADHRLDAENFE